MKRTFADWVKRFLDWLARGAERRAAQSSCRG
jgi:hypothetical protein